MAPRGPGHLRPLRLISSRPGRVCLRDRGGAALQRRCISHSWLARKAENERIWEEQGQEITDGKRRHVWDVIRERGLVKDTAGDPELLRKIILKKRVGAYAGIDPTAESLHVGHLLPLMPLMWMHFFGMPTHTVIGGATARFGDPTGRLQSREILRNAEIAKNMAMIHYQLKKVWDNAKTMGEIYGYQGVWGGEAHLRNNNMWLQGLTAYDFGKHLLRHMRLGPMLSRDTVKNKLENGDGLSLTELLYPMFQGWDFWKLYSTNGVQIQVGGSDQFGNIVTGVDCVKIIRASEPMEAMKIPDDWTHEPVGFTTPLLVDSKGVKLGKSEGNAVWFDVMKTPAFDLYGYFVRRSDEEVENLLKLFTFIPLPDIAKIMEHHKLNPANRVAQHTLAFEVCSLVHSPPVALRERMQHQLMFSKEQPDPEAFLLEDVKTAATGVKSKHINNKDGLATDLQHAAQTTLKLPESLLKTQSINKIFFACGLVQSASEGHALMKQGGGYVAAAPGKDMYRLRPGNLDWTPVKQWLPGDVTKFIIDDKLLILRKGKHNVRIVEMVSDEEWKGSGQTYPGEPYTGRVRMLKQALREAGQLPDGKTAGNLTRINRRVANNPDIELPNKRLHPERWFDRSGAPNESHADTEPPNQPRSTTWDEASPQGKAEESRRPTGRQQGDV